MNSKIQPNITLARRAFSYPRMWKLELFLSKLANVLYNRKGQTTIFQVTSPPPKHKFHNISKALRKKNIEQINFFCEYKVLLPRKSLIVSILKDALRITMRELATFGMPKTEKLLRFGMKDGSDKRRLRCFITISPKTETQVDVSLGIG